MKGKWRSATRLTALQRRMIWNLYVGLPIGNMAGSGLTIRGPQLNGAITRNVRVLKGLGFLYAQSLLTNSGAEWLEADQLTRDTRAELDREVAF